jgi:hypothetical protein
MHQDFMSRRVERRLTRRVSSHNRHRNVIGL